jgi:methylenetetrahydrofolate dehydrogenase (NADP+)/methenyltetrahydrofolate cyclohydrolase
MAAEIISGATVAEQIRAELKVKVQDLKAKGINPGVVFVRVGEDPASISYVQGKGKGRKECAGG